MTLNLPPSDITLTDFFCGAGGSSTGAVKALGNRGRVVMAANHWKRAIETHSLNHPTTDHDIADLQETHPSRYPRTTIAWFSPECTNHSVAKGRKRKNLTQMDFERNTGIDPAEERSRATMLEVVQFTEYHRYEVVIVENVIDIRKWHLYGDWLSEMLNLGYDHKVLYLNAMFFGVPQSRDRVYIVFWKRGNPAPNLKFTPPAICEKHGLIDAQQAWKRSKKRDYEWGRYGKHGQYLYHCPHCNKPVKPFYVPAAVAIDWSIPSQRIGDRKKPLESKTIARIEAGLRKFSRPVVVDSAYSTETDPSKARPVDQPFATQTTRQTLGLAEPFIASQHEGRDAVREVGRELPCITTFNNEHALVTPSPFIIVLKNSHSEDGEYTLPPRALTDVLTTVIATGSQHAVITPFIAELHGTSVARGIDDPLMAIVASAQHHGFVQPFLTSVNYFDDIVRGVNEPLPTQTTAPKLGLTTPSGSSIVMSYYGESPTFARLIDPFPTMRTVEHEALINPKDLIDDCGFRMLSPEELKIGMSFPRSYVITGNQREQVRQVGDAVACNVAEAIIRRCVESLA